MSTDTSPAAESRAMLSSAQALDKLSAYETVGQRVQAKLEEVLLGAHSAMIRAAKYNTD